MGEQFRVGCSGVPGTAAGFSGGDRCSEQETVVGRVRNMYQDELLVTSSAQSVSGGDKLTLKPSAN